MKSFKKALSAVMALIISCSASGLLAVAEDAETAAVEALPLGTYEAESLPNTEQIPLRTDIDGKIINGEYSGEGFVYITSGQITANIEVQEDGMYSISARCAQILDAGGRQQAVRINGIVYSYSLPYLDTWTDVNLGVFRLKKGENLIEFISQYGYEALDTIKFEKAVLPEVIGTGETCDPKATPETKSLLKYLNSVYGKNILSGQQEIYGGGHGKDTSIRYDAEKDICIDENGVTYRFDEESKAIIDSSNATYPYSEKDTVQNGQVFVWTCYGEDGQDYHFNTQNRGYSYNDYNEECEYLNELTGHYPAIRGFDFNCHNPGFAWEDGVTDRMIDWAVNKNGICTASWHITVPTSMDDFEVDEDGNITKISNDWQKFTYGISTDFVTANCVVEGTKEYYFFQEAMRLLAEQLQKLQDANVPVIFRPLHEAEGNSDPEGTGAGSWFWWSKEGTEVYHQVWKLLYTTLTEKYNLHNIIWEQNLYAWGSSSANWYTGDEWVDIVGFDKYNTQYNRHDGNTSGPNEDAESKIFWSLVDYVDNKKMVSMPENDSIPSLENMQIEQAKWLYFCTWYDESYSPKFISGEEYQNPETVKTLFQSDYCITLDELPENLYSFDGDSTEETKPADETETTEEPQPTTGTDDPALGDVNLDGEIDIMDIILLNKAIFGKAELTEVQEKAADVNKSGSPDSTDALTIMKYIIKLITSFTEAE